MMLDKGSIHLVKGSKYKVRSLGTREQNLESTGTYKGYASIAGDEAMVIELGEEHGEDKGLIRLLPLHMIVAIDILEPAKEVTEKSDDKTPMFG